MGGNVVDDTNKNEGRFTVTMLARCKYIQNPNAPHQFSYNNSTQQHNVLVCVVWHCIKKTRTTWDYLCSMKWLFKVQSTIRFVYYYTIIPELKRKRATNTHTATGRQIFHLIQAITITPSTHIKWFILWCVMLLNLNNNSYNTSYMLRLEAAISLSLALAAWVRDWFDVVAVTCCCCCCCCARVCASDDAPPCITAILWQLYSLSMPDNTTNSDFKVITQAKHYIRCSISKMKQFHHGS